MGCAIRARHALGTRGDVIGDSHHAQCAVLFVIVENRSDIVRCKNSTSKLEALDTLYGIGAITALEQESIPLTRNGVTAQRVLENARVIPIATYENVRSSSSYERIIPRPAVETVIAIPGHDQVCSLVAGNAVSAPSGECPFNQRAPCNGDVAAVSVHVGKRPIVEIQSLVIGPAPQIDRILATTVDNGTGETRGERQRCALRAVSIDRIA